MNLVCVRHTHRRLAGLVLAAMPLLAAAAAQAQTIGHYEGTTSQGHAISLDVIDDGSGGTAFGGGSLFWEATCTKSGPGRGVGWGVGANVPFSGQKLSAEFRFNALYERWKMTFDGDTVSGTFLGRTPEFTDPEASTKSVQLCDSGTLSFSASRVSAQATRRVLTPGQAMPLR